MDTEADATLLRAWLEGRSLARGLPAPVSDRGGFRVDTNSDVEVCRWIFPCVNAGLVQLGRDLREPRHLLKLCGSEVTLRAVLPDRWAVQPPGYFMKAVQTWPERPLPPGYMVTATTSGSVSQVQVLGPTGDLAASGYAANATGAFVYDRIITAQEHRRRGLAQVVMSTLRTNRRATALPELLVATKDGRALYKALGWRVLSTYSTALIPR